MPLTRSRGLTSVPVSGGSLACGVAVRPRQRQDMYPWRR